MSPLADHADHADDMKEGSCGRRLQAAKRRCPPAAIGRIQARDDAGVRAHAEEKTGPGEAKRVGTTRKVLSLLGSGRFLFRSELS